MTVSAVSVCIVIPVYKATLTQYESIALTQCMRILGHYPVIFAKPHSLDLSPVLQTLPASVQVRSFNDAYFQSVQSYNRLMLSATFYQAFADFEYMLIHQLDAFVFSDELASWCTRGYDYIGAPWLRDCDFDGQWSEYWFNTKKQIALWLDLRKDDGITPREITTLNGVGNGGLSLRHIAHSLNALRKLQARLDKYESVSAHQFNEDVFWGVEVNRYWRHLHVPDFRTAMQFAVEFYPERAVSVYNRGKLPFGCHAWDIHGTDYWRPIFAQYGYTI
ncbi:DUF5672 family protein [Fibrella arboris]|uniref:DUF5672 family protein n=1 Tax=Fibrella arboris TaxID=3242486 RepID=UPI0035223DE7